MGGHQLWEGIINGRAWEGRKPKTTRMPKNQTKKLPLKIQKPKISLKSQNVRKLTPPNMPTDSKKSFNFFLKTQKSN